ncbi:MAG: translation elongation factor Ts [Planctomycetota bacterium]|jgi:elongation factor Ts
METSQVSFSAKDVMALRQKTGLGMMACKKALTETGGDMEAAEQLLREQMKGKMESRTERATGEGRIGIAVDGTRAAIVEVRTETDFTARNEAFVKTVDEVATAALALPAGDVAATDDMAKQIDDLRITTGENVNFSRGVRLDGGSFGSYLHFDGKRAALVQVEGAADADLLKGVCQHIVFHDPHGISEDDVPAETIDRIRSEAIAAAKESGKPEQIAGKIADGKVRKFLEENTLLHQKYVLDDSKTVREILPGGVTITRFVRYTLGG